MPEKIHLHSQEKEIILPLAAQTGFKNLCDAFDKVGRIRSYLPNQLRVVGWIHGEGDPGSEIIAQITPIDAKSCRLALQAHSDQGSKVTKKSLEKLLNALKRN